MIATHQTMTISNEPPPKNCPNSAIDKALGAMGVLVAPVSRTASPRVRPITANIVPMVTMSEGIPVRSTRRPFTYPTSRPMLSARTIPTPSGAPKYPAVIATHSDDAGIVAPMDMSSSPAIIRSPIGSATIPTSAATFNQLAKPATETKLAPAAAEKKEKTATIPRNEPASGLLISCPKEGYRA